MNLKELPEPLQKRIDQLYLGCRAIHREVRKTQTDCHVAGVRFPDSLDICLGSLEYNLDQVALLLDERILAEDQTRRNAGSSTEPGASPKD